MRRLITDLFVRKMAQGALLIGLGVLLALQVAFVGLLLIRINAWLDRVPGLQTLVLDLLRFPFEKDFAAFSVVIGGVIPVIVSVVCFRIDQGAATEDLNKVGHTAVALLSAGLLFGLISLLVSGLYAGDMESMVGTSESRVAVRNSLAAILAFHSLYLTQLMGLKK